MRPEDTNDPQALALHALAACLSDEARAQRLLALSGLTPDDLRDRLGDPGLLASCLDFLMGHEPDLVAVAAQLETRPEALVAARAALGA